MQEHLFQKIRQGGLSIEQQKKLIGSLIHLDIQGDPAWESVQTRCPLNLTFFLLISAFLTTYPVQYFTILHT
jgi:hypothetical protein